MWLVLELEDGVPSIVDILQADCSEEHAGKFLQSHARRRIKQKPEGQLAFWVIRYIDGQEFEKIEIDLNK